MIVPCAVKSVTGSPPGHAGVAVPDLAVGLQYDTTHVYVAPDDFDRFVASLLATLGGTTSKEGVFTVTPTPSKTMSQLVLTPVRKLSVFGFKTPVPYPFGAERTGYLVTDIDAAIVAARATGADILVTPFNDPIGRDAIIQWPSGVNTQLYWHTQAPSYKPLQTIPENRVYVSTMLRRVSFAASWPFRTAKSSPTMRMRPASKSDGRLTPTVAFVSNQPSASWRRSLPMGISLILTAGN